MTSEDFTVAFHIGAHKTATSHLQRSLLSAADALAEAGVRYYGPEYFRLPGRSINALFGSNEAERPRAPRRPVEDQLRLMRKGAQRLVLSEENFVGVLNSPRRHALTQRYPNAAPRITALAATLGREIDVFLSVRRPTAFINSAYCQMLMGGRVMPMARYKEINPLATVDWLDLVTRLRATPGVGALTVWRYEDYAQLFPEVCHHLVGAAHADLVHPLTRRIHVGLSSPAVAEVLHRHADHDAKDLGYGARRLLPVEDGYPPFDGFDAAAHAAGDAGYAAQMAAIAAMEDVRFLQP